MEMGGGCLIEVLFVGVWGFMVWVGGLVWVVGVGLYVVVFVVLGYLGWVWVVVFFLCGCFGVLCLVGWGEVGVCFLVLCLWLWCGCGWFGLGFEMVWWVLFVVYELCGVGILVGGLGGVGGGDFVGVMGVGLWLVGGGVGLWVCVFGCLLGVVRWGLFSDVGMVWDVVGGCVGWWVGGWV
uniref:NADH dehydrogenase subunit 6 n=1 Tax=Knipowitschia caucasica TaxID=637954 RepID=A0AAV2MMZ1_KNICA